MHACHYEMFTGRSSQRGALRVEGETGDVSSSIIPAQARILCSALGFRVAACGPRIKYGAGSPGMMGSSFSSFQRKLESRGMVQVGHFVSEQE